MSSTGFGATSTAEEVIKGIDLTGKNALVTGGYSGIGLETVRVLLNAGAHVIVPARDEGKARAALGVLADKVELAQLELTDPESIKKLTDDYLATGRPLHILVLNAGIMAVHDYTKDKQGNELQFSTNYLGHYQLTVRLWSALKKADGARIVSVSSTGHLISDIRYDDHNFEKGPYVPFLAYGQSKTANILLAVMLEHLGKPFGITAVSVHPGVVNTNLTRYMTDDDFKQNGWLDENGNQSELMAKLLKTVEQGAATQVFCATHPVEGGRYYFDCNVAREIEGSAPPEDWTLPVVADYAVDPENAKKLWKLSEKITGVTI